MKNRMIYFVRYDASDYGLAVKNELDYQREHVRNTPELVAATQEKRSPYKATWCQFHQSFFNGNDKLKAKPF